MQTVEDRAGLMYSLGDGIENHLFINREKNDKELADIVFLTRSPTPAFPEGEGSKNGGYSPDTNGGGVFCTTMHYPPMAHHSGVAVGTSLSCAYDTHFYDVIGLPAFSSLPLVGFCWTADG